GPSAEARHIEIQSTLELISRPFYGDPPRLQQMLGNLLSNAVKFTPEGGRVRATLASAGDRVEIRVSDTGRGIRSEFLPHVFERFRQEDASMAREQGGLGIGLSLVKELAELHGGEISASSEGPGKGATFTLRLPFAKPAQWQADERTC